MKCCDFHHIDCDQGDQCPIRIAGLSRLPTPTQQDDTDDLTDDTGLMLLQGIALLVCIVSVIVYVSLYFT